MYKKDLKACVYVCTQCFNKIENCTCRMFPETLLHLDKNILPIVKVLNDKWYFTESCCEGHIGESDNPFIYIIFTKAYKVNIPAPQGVEYKSSVLRANIPGKSDEAKKRNKRKLLKSIFEWACKLENRNPGNRKFHEQS